MEPEEKSDEQRSEPRAAPAGAAAARQRLRELGAGAAWLVGIGAALRIVDLVLGRIPLAAALAGAVLVDALASRAGVRWDAEAPPAEGPAAWKRALALIGRGAAWSAAAAFLVIVLGRLLGWASIDPGRPGTGLLLAVVRAGAMGVRDELWLRGVVLSAGMRAGLPAPARVAFAACAGGAAIALAPGANAASLALTVASGALFAALWLRTRTAWAPIAANACWSLLAGPASRGGLLDVTWTAGSLSTGPRAHGLPAILAAVVLALLTALALRGTRRTSARGPA